MRQKRKAARWAKGTYMKLRSGATLRALMDQNGKSLRDVGRYVGRHWTFIGQLVREERKTCKPEVAERITDLLNVPLDVLFDVSLSSTEEQRVTHSRTKQAKEVAA